FLDSIFSFVSLNNLILLSTFASFFLAVSTAMMSRPKETGCFMIALRSRVFCSCSCPGILVITVEEGICDVIPEIKMMPEIIADDDETFNLLECVSSIDCAHLETGIVGVGV